MSYPKPLSEETLKKMYIEADIDEAKSDFLHKFFLGASNLYGCISISELWDIYFGHSYLKKGTKYHKSDFIKFSSIARREDLPYRIYEINDIYEDEERKDIERMIMNKDIIDDFNDTNPFHYYYQIETGKRGKSYYIPDDMLDCVEMKKEKEEIVLEEYLGNLKVTEHRLMDEDGKPIEREDNRGKKLKEVYYFSSAEKDEKQSVLQDTKEPVNEKLVRSLKTISNRGRFTFGSAIEHLMNELYEYGVELNDKQTNELLQMMQKFVNNIHLYANAGWKPDEMR